MCNEGLKWIDIHCVEGFVGALIILAIFAILVGVKVYFNIKKGKRPSDILG